MELVFPDLARLFLAMVFLSSALGKLRDVHDFTSTVLDYRILPQHWARRFAGTLPWVEVFIGVMLLIGLGVKLAAGISGLLLLSFIFAVSLNLRRGRTDLNCGCSGARHPQKISGKLILRNAILLLLSAQVMLWGQDSPAVHSLSSSVLAFLMTHVLLVGGGLPLTLVVSGSLMLALLIRQVRRFVQMEARR